MAVNRGLWVPINTGNVGTTEVEARLADVGLFESNNGTDARSGVLNPGPASLITGNAGPGWTYNIAPATFVVGRTVGEGCYRFSSTGATVVSTTAPPVSGSRIDVVWVKQNDQSKGDPNNLAVAGVTQGGASGTPVAPSIPAGALELAQATITSATTATNVASIAQTFRHAALRGAPIVIRSAVELAEITAPRLEQRVIYQAAGSRLLRWTGSRWGMAGDTTLGRSAVSGATTLAAAPGWTTITSVSAITNGGEVIVDFDATYINANSGDHRTSAIRVQCDGVDVDSYLWFSQWINTANVPTFPGQKWGHTPPAGAHVWTLQGNANVAGAMQSVKASMVVTERP